MTKLLVAEFTSEKSDDESNISDKLKTGFRVNSWDKISNYYLWFINLTVVLSPKTNEDLK